MISPKIQGTTRQAAYDIVGKYNQDRINGFDENFLESFVKLIDLENANNVLDAMSGDGNLTRRAIDYCSSRKINLPLITLLEYSSVQTELARSSIHSELVSIINGDVLSMIDIESGEQLPDSFFDRVVIKSGTHEIPARKQHQLYESVFRVLKPGGLFINLGFVFDDIRERDEFLEITKVKDSLIGAEDAVANRYFLMREELYGFLEGAGFQDAQGRLLFEYAIRSEVVEKEYFSEPKSEQAMQELKIAQSRAKILRQNGRVTFDGDRSIMRLPGEITVAVKPHSFRS